MMLPGKKTLIGLAAAGLLLAGAVGTALADDETTSTGTSRYQQFIERLAAALGKQPDEVRSAITQVRNQFIDEAVAAGKIPADRAQELKDRAAQDGGMFFGPHPGHGRGKGPGMAGHPGGGVLGEITNVAGKTLTVKTPAGDQKTVLLTDATQVYKGRETADASTLTVGTRIAVHGQADAQGVVTAAKVKVFDGSEGYPGPRHGRRGPAGQPPASAN